LKYIGIDLGTTNSAICSYDGESVHLYKSNEQHDVTPSAIFIDPRGNKYVGSRAYNNAARSPDNAATLFKRLMGTGTPIKLAGVGRTMTPEECSAEILRALFAYLPEELRNDPGTGTVITVPAAFNQMQKDATMSAADSAGLGKVALMQEPVAAVMSVMRQRKSDGIFLVYDLGGGTLDVAIAQSISGRVSLLAHGGIAMCGGRDFDRMLFDNLVRPWLMENFDLPEDLSGASTFKPLVRMATWAAEKAKIELSQREESVISASETEIGIKDLAGVEVYIDIPLSRASFDELIRDKVDESVQATRDALEKAQLSPHDVERMVFVGGPTQYKPLRDKVSFELGIAASTDVNPMTAVAEGAAVFAESIDWDSQSRGRKSARGTISGGGKLNLSFSYVSRTPDTRAKLVLKMTGNALPGAEFQVDSLDTGWSSGRLPLKDGAAIELGLSRPAENVFKVFVFDATGGPISFPQDRIVITRTAASIDAIPSSSSIGIQAREKIGGAMIIDYLVREGDQLPKRGKRVFKAEESLRAGAAGAIRFKLFEGEITDPIDDNDFIGLFEINGADFEQGVIAAGADLLCDFEVLDSGNIILEVTVPSIGAEFQSRRNFYARQQGQIDYSMASRRIKEQSVALGSRLNDIQEKIDDPRLEQARKSIDAVTASTFEDSDPESAKEAMDSVQSAKRLLARVRKDHLKEIRQMELDSQVSLFNEVAKKHAKTSEESTFDNLVITARRAIDGNSRDFESHLQQMRWKMFAIMWRQDWFVIDRFKWLAEAAYLFPDAEEHTLLVQKGLGALESNDIDDLRGVVNRMDFIRVNAGNEEQMMATSNIVRG